MLEPDRVLTEMKALQTHFKAKRDYVLERLRKLGFKIKNVPDSTFYIWLDLSSLPAEINDGLNFFQQCLIEHVIGMPPTRFTSCKPECESLTYHKLFRASSSI